jgi:hypothetical protein
MAWAPDNFKTELQLASEIVNISCVKSVDVEEVQDLIKKGKVRCN